MNNEQPGVDIKTSSAEAYNSPSWWYDIRGFFILSFAYNTTLGELFKFFAPHFGYNHLEAACGSGKFMKMCLHWRKRRNLPAMNITAFDNSERMLKGAYSSFKNYRNVHIALADVNKLSYANDSFDTINLANALHCFSNVQGALKEMYRVLKPSGTLATNVLLVPRTWPFRTIATWINNWGMRKGILFKPYTQDEISMYFLKAGFEIAYGNVSGNCYNVLLRKPVVK